MRHHLAQIGALTHTWTRQILFLEWLALGSSFRRYRIHAIALLEIFYGLEVMLNQSLLCGGMSAMVPFNRIVRTSASACRSGSREKTLMVLSLAPLTMSPVSGHAATVQMLRAGCVIVWIHCPFLQTLTVRSSDELTKSPLGRMARLYIYAV